MGKVELVTFPEFSRSGASPLTRPTVETIMSTSKQSATPQEIDDMEDRMGSIEQLDFSDRQDLSLIHI